MKNKFSILLYQLKVYFLKPKYSEKVFCIGFNKTGTTSCGKAFQLLGYKNLSFDLKIWRDYYKNSSYLKILNYAAKFDSFDDLPWLKEDMIPLLDKVFPKSKFVYLERDEDSWLKSFNNWTFKQTGKYPDLDKAINEFRNHRIFVMDYFKNRKEDLLIINISEKDAFLKLAKFLGKETAFTEMPHENKT